MRARDAAPENAGNADGIGRHLSDGGQTENGVECDGTSEVDEGDSNCDESGEDDRVDWEMIAGIDVTNPSAEWHTAVTSLVNPSVFPCALTCGREISYEGEGLPRRRSLIRDVADHEQEELKEQQAHGQVWHARQVQHVDQWKAGWVVDRVVDARASKEERDQSDEADGGIDDDRPDHRSRHGKTSVTNFLRHVGGGVGPYI